MPTRIILDKREKYMRALFTSRKIPYEESVLDLGDVLIMYSKGDIPKDSGSLGSGLSESARRLLGSSSKEESAVEPVQTLVIERKTYTDLKGSIEDGRYHEQKSRYIKLPRGSMYYILENNDRTFAKLGRDQYLGMYTHTMIRDDIGVFHTESLEDTVDLIVKIADTLERFGGFNSQISKAPRVEETQIKKKKAKGKEVYRQQLTCFSGISDTKAADIAKVYPSMKSLMDSLEKNTFKVKGIGPKLLASIKDGLFPAESTSKIVFDDS